MPIGIWMVPAAEECQLSNFGEPRVMYRNGGRNVGVCQHTAEERDNGGTSVP